MLKKKHKMFWYVVHKTLTAYENSSLKCIIYKHSDVSLIRAPTIQKPHYPETISLVQSISQWLLNFWVWVLGCSQIWSTRFESKIVPIQLSRYKTPTVPEIIVSCACWGHVTFEPGSSMSAGCFPFLRFSVVTRWKSRIFLPKAS